MSETLCTLRTKGGGGGAKLVETVLWTNPSPTSAFSAQAVTLSETIDNYDYIKILFRKSTSDATSYNLMTDVSTWTTIYISGDTDRGFRLLGNTIVSSATNYRACTCVNTDHTKVQIGNVSGGGGTSYIIPTAIIGIKNMGGWKDNQSRYGTVSVPNNSSFTSVNIGFRPKYLEVLRYVDSNNIITSTFNYDGFSSTQYIRGYKKGTTVQQNIYTLGDSRIGSISLSDSGFSIYCDDSTFAGIWYYTAIK